MRAPLPLLALPLALAACSASSPRPRPAPQAWAPPPPAAPALAPGAPQPGAAAPPAWGFSPAPPPSAWPSLPSLPSIFRPVNVSALQSMRGRRCAPKEVVPGVWVGFDCGMFQPIARAIPFVRSARMGFVTGPLPAEVDHRQRGLTGPIKNQQAVGACTAFSLSSAMDHAIRKLSRQEVTAPLHVWSKYGVPSMGTAGDQTSGETITVEQAWPYDPVKACKMMRDPFDSCGAAYNVQPGTGDGDPTILAEKQRADTQGRYKIIAIEQLNTKPVDVQELAAVLAGGDALWASFWVDGDAWTSRALRNGVLPEYYNHDNSGHAVVLVGYRTVGGAKQFLIHNSWGDRWGEGGYGWISESNVVRHIRAAYKVRIGDPSAPGPAPNAAGCPSGQVRDSVLGTCAPLCASGSAPAAGVCLPTIPGFTPPGLPPGLPGPLPLPQPQPQPQGGCPQGQAPDMMSGQCAPLCPSGTPAIGGMCLPTLPR